MPIELGETIEAMSKTVRRPMNTEIVLLLEYALKEKGRKRNAKKAHIPDNTTNPRQEYAG
jgi:hypothetical protein